MISLRELHPIEMGDLLRIGNKYDGGYILSGSQIKYTKILLSFGIFDDWSFEEDFSKNKNIKIYSYDYYTNIILNRSFGSTLYHIFRSCAAIIYHSLHLNPSRIKKNFRRISLKSNFYKFFSENEKTEVGSHNFIPKFIGNYDDHVYTTADSIFRELGMLEDLSIFVKMDIEGSEYNSLGQFIPYFDKINGFAVEFHRIEKNATKFETLLKELLLIFHIIHVHGCNNMGYIENTDIPSVLEITFINKKIAPKNIQLSSKTYPIKGLDWPCIPYKKDLLLNFSR